MLGMTFDIHGPRIGRAPTWGASLGHYIGGTTPIWLQKGTYQSILECSLEAANVAACSSTLLTAASSPGETSPAAPEGPYDVGSPLH